MTTLTDTQKAVLDTEIANDPLDIGYDLFLPDSPGHAVDLLNEKTQTKIGQVDTDALTIWAVSTSMRSVIEDESQDKTSPLRDSALAILDVLRGAATGINFSKQENMDVLNGWEALGKLSTEHKNALLALAQKPASRAEVLDLPFIFEDMLRQ